MLRKDIPFETGRSKNLLKVKKFDDAEYVVKNVEIGEMTTAEPLLGNVTFEGVRALFIEQRIAWKKDPSKIIGKTICVKYFEETKNQNGTYSLRFPILKWVYDGKRDC